MYKLFISLLSLLFLLAGCSSQKQLSIPRSVDIVNLQVVKTIGPNIVGTRSLNSPRAIAVNQAGEIYIADYGNDRIVKFDSTFSFIQEIGGFGAGEYALNGPLDIAVDKVSNLYVVDFGNKRVVRLDRHLNYISSYDGYYKEELVEFIRPVSIGVSNRNEILIGDEGLAACYKLDQFFTYQFEFATRDEIYSVLYPSTVYQSNGVIYVTDPEYGYVFKYDEFGLFVGKIGEDALTEPVSIASSGKSGIWIADRKSSTLHLFNSRGKELFRWDGSGEYSLYRPEDICIDNNDLIYVVDSQVSRILILKPLMGN